jgi:hypothetical protein
VRTDKLYRTRENRNWSKKRGIRDAVKGNFGQAQQRYGPFGQEQHDGGLGHFSGDESGSAVQPAFFAPFRMALLAGEPHRKYPSDKITPGCGDALLFERLSIGLARPNYQHSNKFVGLLY